MQRAGGRSRGEHAYEALRTSILRGRYRPNQRLIETDVAEELGASRTPVREAFHRLSNDGLIVKSRRGWEVREFTRIEIQEIYETRTALEGYAARLAATRATESQIAHLAGLIEDQRAVIARGRVPGEDMVALNDRFHDGLIAAAGNRRLAEAVQRSRAYYFNYRLAALYSEEQKVHALEDHEWLLEAVRRRDGDKAELLVREHIMSALKMILDKLA